MNRGARSIVGLLAIGGGLVGVELSITEARAFFDTRWRVRSSSVNNCMDNRPECCADCNPDLTSGQTLVALYGMAASLRAAQTTMSAGDSLSSDDASSQLAEDQRKAPSKESVIEGSAVALKAADDSASKNDDGSDTLNFGSRVAVSGSAGGAGGPGGAGGSLLDRLFKRFSGGENSASSSADAGKAASDGESSAQGSGSGKGWSSGSEMRGLASVAGIKSDGKSGGMDFGSSGKVEVNPMGSQDPEDYFARTDLALSLFKVVERRYQREYVAWNTKPTKPENSAKPGRSK